MTTETKKPMTKKAAEQAARDAGRACLRAWLEGARENGEVYYVIPSVSRSGMSRTINLYRPEGCKVGERIALGIDKLWPSAPGLPDEASEVLGGYSEALNIIARDWGFSYKDRAFRVNGCGMDMVFALIHDLAGLSGLEPDYANRVHRSSL